MKIETTTTVPVAVDLEQLRLETGLRAMTLQHYCPAVRAVSAER